MRLRVAVRLLSIQRALVRHGLDDFIRATHLYRPFRFLFYLSPWTWFQRSEGRTRGERLRLALEELGPIFVKFGQAVSTRRDLIPADIADELVRLQDRVPPFPGDVAAAAVEEALGAGLAEIFSSFDRTALAAASIAQVHAATLLGGEDVVVKILRPGMHEIIDLDLEVMDALAALADQYWVQSRRLRPTELVREYRKTILDEELEKKRMRNVEPDSLEEAEDEEDELAEDVEVEVASDDEELHYEEEVPMSKLSSP